MPIEFRCLSCQKLLRVPDGSAGRKAKCPHCTAVVQIPDAEPASPPPSTPSQPLPSQQPPSSNDPFGLPASSSLPDAADPFPQQSSGSDPSDIYGVKNDPFASIPEPGSPPNSPFGSTPSVPIPPSAASSEFGPDAMGDSPFEDNTPFTQNGPEETGNPYQAPGEYTDYQQQTATAMGGPINPTVVSISDFIGRTYVIFKNRMGISIGLYLLLSAIMFGVNIITAPLTMVSPFMQIPMTIIQWLVQLYLYLGLMKAMLHICRGQNAEVGDLFRGGPWYPRAVGYLFLLFTLVLIPAGIAGGAMFYGVQMLTQGSPLGAIALIVAFFSGIACMLLWLWTTWGFYAIIDQECSVFDALRISWEITSVNTLRLIGLYLLIFFGMMGLVFILMLFAIIPLGFIITIIGGLALAICAVVFFYPFMAVLGAASYLMMSGQRLAYQPDSGYASRLR